jgi:hypothetical protein
MKLSFILSQWVANKPFERTPEPSVAFGSLGGGAAQGQR